MRPQDVCGRGQWRSSQCLPQQEDEFAEGEDDAEVQQECLRTFSTRDYIMEPSIFNTLKRRVRALGVGRGVAARRRTGTSKGHVT